MDASTQNSGASGQPLTVYTENRPWGSFTVLQDLPHYKLKSLTVNPGQRLSLQLHHKREEHWIIVRGTPQITLGDSTWRAKTGDYIHVPVATRHRIANPGPEVVELVEIQQGSYFGEDDIVRFEDDYQRI
jgi:mannose-6-phosphate isomerase-like protein (cupin superfamily)